MKNHIIFKFIAVLLCAVSLLGSVGSAVGIYVMTELDLFDKTVDQVQNEQLQSTGQEFAREAALRYASRTLGSCPEEMLDYHFGTWLSDLYEDGQYSYSITDTEGTEVYRYGEATAATSEVFRFDVSGQYLHLVSVETEAERNERLQKQAASYSAIFAMEEDAQVMDALPPEGQHVSYASFCDSEGTVVYEAYGEEGVGFLYYNEDGRVVFAGSQYLYDMSLLGIPIAGVFFQDLDGNIVYQASCRDGVGVASFNNAGQLIFTVGDYAPAAAAETEPPAEEPAPSAILPVYYAALYDEKDNKIYRVRGTESVGFLSLNQEGHLVYRGFQAEQERLSDAVTITGAYFCDPEDNKVYEVWSNDSVGTVSYTDNGQLIFTSAEPAPEFDPAALAAEAEEEAPLEETAAEETGETEETAAAEETEETAAESETEETREQSSPSDIPEASAATEVTEETIAPTAETEASETTAETEAAEATIAAEATVAAEIPEETAAAVAAAALEAADPELINGKPLEEYQVQELEYYDPALEDHAYASFVYVPMPEYTVELQLAPGALRSDSEYRLLQIVQAFSGYLFPALIVCLLVFAITAVYLCCSAGRKPRSETVHAGGLNCLPLDLYTVLIVLEAALAANVISETAQFRMEGNFLFSCGLIVAAAFLTSLVIVAFFYALAAQVKTPGGYWWRNALGVRFIMLFMHFGVWLERFLSRKLFPFLGRVLRWLWKLAVKVVLGFFHLWQRFADWFLQAVQRFFRWFHKVLHRFFSLLPITWQWLIGGGLLIFIAAVFINDAISPNVGFVALILCFGIVFYIAHCFGVLGESARRMSKGDLDTKVDDKLLIGCFRDFAGDLNNLADVAVVAAQKQLKSERMKTELITNVSHDIKTPLTSIINYVDLLQKPHNPEQEAQYLEVLNRQSLRLKKLIDDLMEMSKASTGNMTVEITTVDAVESVNQALGEFSDKLSAARLTPMFRHTEPSAPMLADGKLVWRVLSNLLTNAVKYAMPGTRLYIDLMELEGKVVISIKNISREELNVDAEELMERFVRGDDSRNTEGSGLGLNIAKSLMELQKGQLQLLVDGDLFKVTLIFPGA